LLLPAFQSEDFLLHAEFRLHAANDKSGRLRCDAPRLVARLTLSNFCGVSSINLSHDLFCPSDCIRYRAYRCWHSFPAIELGKFSGRENGSCDQQNSLSALVHSSSVAYSPFVRYCRMGQQPQPPERVFRRPRPHEDAPAALVTKAKIKG
jgi:hypothetical protein